MTKRNIFYSLLIIAVMLCACRGSSKSATTSQSANSSIKEAKLLSITHDNGFTKVEITNPWDTTKILHTYILVPSSQKLPKHLPKGTVVRTPVKKVLVYSSVHSSVLRELQSGNTVKGVCDAQYFNDSIIDKGIKDGSITDCGNSMQPSVEKVIEMKPDAILLSPYQDATYGQIAKLNIPIVECADYMEYTPLGRAEWIKFYGELVCQPELAEQIYNKVVEEYNKVKKSVADKKLKRPLVLTENVISGIWNVPGGQSYMAQFIKDAGGDYPWKDDKNTGSLTLDFNQVLAKAQTADYWLIKSPNMHTFGALKASYSLNDKFKAYKTGNVYICDTNTSHFFDRFPFHPEELLKEYFKIFHPEVETDYQLQFFHQIAQQYCTDD
ncbi:MAG: ABC transporter substrate-binding protein [Muribaculaceae bacterium]|nr:ABC transporter substrate-binding protein [Muribaculaceae bacterium]